MPPSRCAVWSVRQRDSIRPAGGVHPLALPPECRAHPFNSTRSNSGPRNINPLVVGDSPVSIYDPATGEVHGSLEESWSIPVKVVQHRLYTTNMRVISLGQGLCPSFCPHISSQQPQNKGADSVPSVDRTKEFRSATP